MTDPGSALGERVAFLVPLNKLGAERQARLLAQSDLLELRKKEVLFRQGERDDYTFYLVEGDIEMYADDSLIKRVSGGEGASFQPLSQLQPRAMTAIARSKARVLRLKRSLLEQLLSMDEAPAAAPPDSGVEVAEVEVAGDTDWLLTLLQSELFTRIPPANIQSLLDTLESVQAAAGEVVVRQGDPGDYYYVVQSGTCEVVRAGANRREIRLAELGPGDTFGEEALISGTRRNASVRMRSDGELARLTKDDFIRLIRAPLLKVVGREQAAREVGAGARWLDVRFEDEHRHNGLPDSLNIPLGTLRTRMDGLDPALRYITYCDTGGRSSAAAFLLAEKGFDVAYVEGGAVSEPVPASPAAAPPASPPAPTPRPAPAAGDQVLAAAVRASSLEAEVAKATHTIEQAQKLMAEAASLKADADAVVAAKLAREREHLAREQEALARQRAETEALRAELAAEQERLHAALVAERERLAARQAEIEREAAERAAEQAARAAHDGAALEARIVAAARQQAELEERQRAAEAETARLHAELVERQEELRAKAAAEQAAQQRRLQDEGEALAAKLAEAEALKAALSRQQAAAEAETTRLQAEVEARAAAAETAAEARLEQEQARLEAFYRAQAERLEAAQAGREAELRERLRGELARERANFERAVADANAELERARAERAAAVAAKAAAAAEAERVIAEFKADQQRLLAEQQANFELERARLRAEAARIEQLRAEAAAARREAEVAKAAAERELTRARTAQTTTRDTAADENAAVLAAEARASAAARELENARAAESAALSAARHNEDALERTYDTANEIKDLLKRELDDWVDEQESLQESTLQREILSRQKEMVERIRARAAAAKAASTLQTRSLLEEIEDQLSRR